MPDGCWCLYSNLLHRKCPWILCKSEKEGNGILWQWAFDDDLHFTPCNKISGWPIKAKDIIAKYTTGLRTTEIKYKEPFNIKNI